MPTLSINGTLTRPLKIAAGNLLVEDLMVTKVCCWALACCILLVASADSAGLPPSQIRSLLRLPKVLENPPVLKPLEWTQNTSSINFCGIPTGPSLNVTCSPAGTTVLSLLVVGNASAALSPAFSMESLGNLLSSLPDLQDVALVQLGLWGSVPGKLDSLTSLHSLSLSYNYISGELPSDRLTRSGGNLTHIDLSHNQLNGTATASLQPLLSLPSIQILDVSHNRIAGQLPANLAVSPTLVQLDVSDNRLTGALPPALDKKSVKFDGNCLQTTVQPQLRSSDCAAYTKAGSSASQNATSPQASSGSSNTRLKGFALLLIVAIVILFT